MGRTSGQETKGKILKVTERLFSEKGVDATSVDLIANEAGVNKASIYYHFKSKDALIGALFDGLLEELMAYIDRTFDSIHSEERGREEGLRDVLRFMFTKKDIITTIFMESLKKGKQSDMLFKFAELSILRRGDSIKSRLESGESEDVKSDRELFIHEFFTGFVPMISFVVLNESYCSYFEHDSQDSIEIFIDSFMRTHLAHHYHQDENKEE